MRYLAIDHGTKRMGIAVSDEMKVIAQPLEYIPAEPAPRCFARIQEIIAEKEVELILVGMPRNMDGTYGPAAQKVQEFIDALRLSTSLPVQPIDERLTSVQANRVLIAARVRRAERKQKVDPMAAAILLQAYLDARPA
jgi:putative Holliday junction resolvase